MDTPQNSPPVDRIDEWQSFDEAYCEFVEAHPMLGLGADSWAATNLRRNFADRLIAAGVVRQLINRKWIAHRERFGPVLFAMLVRAPGETITRARKRAPGA